MKATRLHNYLFKNENGIVFSDVLEGQTPVKIVNGTARLFRCLPSSDEK
jgi:hypothetical protein